MHARIHAVHNVVAMRRETTFRAKIHGEGHDLASDDSFEAAFESAPVI